MAAHKYVVNAGGAVHSVTAEHFDALMAGEFGQIGTWREASKAEAKACAARENPDAPAEPDSSEGSE